MKNKPCPHCGWPHRTKPTLPSNPFVAAVLAEVCGVFNVDELEAVGQSRAGRLVEVRHLVFALIRKRARMTLGDIGQQIGCRDHTTVLHGVRQTMVRIKADPQFRSIVMANWPAMVHAAEIAAMKSKAGAA